MVLINRLRLKVCSFFTEPVLSDFQTLLGSDRLHSCKNLRLANRVYRQGLKAVFSSGAITGICLEKVLFNSLFQLRFGARKSSSATYIVTGVSKQYSKQDCYQAEHLLLFRHENDKGN